MSDYITWQGTEQSLEQLLIWWSQQISWEHSEDCTRDERTMHCCEGVYEYVSLNTIQGTSGPSPRGLIPILFGDWQGNLFSMEIGDRVYYKGEGIFELTDNEGNRKSGRT